MNWTSADELSAASDAYSSSNATASNRYFVTKGDVEVSDYKGTVENLSSNLQCSQYFVYVTVAQILEYVLEASVNLSKEEEKAVQNIFSVVDPVGSSLVRNILHTNAVFESSKYNRIVELIRHLAMCSSWKWMDDVDCGPCTETILVYSKHPCNANDGDEARESSKAKKKSGKSRKGTSPTNQCATVDYVVLNMVVSGVCECS